MINKISIRKLIPVLLPAMLGFHADLSAQYLKLSYDQSGNRTQLSYTSIKPAKPTISATSTNLSSSSSSGNTWLYNGTLLPDTTKTIKPSASGIYRVIVQYTNGCPSDTSDPYNFVYTAVINLGNNSFISIDPNPVQQDAVLRFSLPNISTLYADVYSVTGAKVISLNNIGSGQLILMSSLPPGIYVAAIYSISHKEINYKFKLIKL